jgi:hypothetical protein
MAQYPHFGKGLWQRQARHLYGDGELVEALNVCPDAYGALTTRPGHVVFASGLDQLDVTAIHTAYNVAGTRRLYAHAGTKLYRDAVAIVTGLSTRKMSFADIRGQGEQTLYTFAANGSPGLLVKDDGTTLTQWGLNPPSVPPGASAASGTLVGTYRWRITYIRKAIPPNVQYGTFVGGLYTYQTGSSLSVSNTTNNDGHFVGAAQPFGEIFYNMTVAGAGGSPVFAYFYWDGIAWESTTPVVTPNFLATGRTRVKFDFPATNWRSMAIGAHTLYPILMQATTAPTSTAPVASPVQAYDTVIAAESNPSDASVEVTCATHAGSLVSIPSSITIGTVDYDPQVTHTGIYRTVANESLETSPFFFVDDLTHGVAAYTDDKPDNLLGHLLEFDNARPQAFTAIAEHQNRLWGLTGNTVNPSKFQQPEAFPPQIAFDVGTLSDPPLTLWSEGGVLYVATAARIYQIVGFGQDAGGNSLYVPQETMLPTGLAAIDSVVHGARADYLLGSDGVLWRMRGPSMAENLSDERFYPLFHFQTINGQVPLNQAARATCASGFYPSRILFSYPEFPATTPNRTLVYDEATDTWYRDSRGFRCYYYDRQSNELFAGLSTGTIVRVEQAGGVGTDAGAAIDVTVQTPDADDGAPTSDKQLVELVVDAASMRAEVTLVTAFGTGPTLPVGTSTHTTRSPQTLVPAHADRYQSAALGYLVRWSGAGTLYRLLPQVLRLPPTRHLAQSLVSDLGWAGFKILVDFVLDVEWLVPGSLTIQFQGTARTGAAWHHARTFTSLTGQRQRLPRERLPAGAIRLLGVTIRSTTPYRLWPGSALHWHPLGGQPGLQTFALAPALVEG